MRRRATPNEGTPKPRAYGCVSCSLTEGLTKSPTDLPNRSARAVGQRGCCSGRDRSLGPLSGEEHCANGTSSGTVTQPYLEVDSTAKRALEADSPAPVRG